MGFIYNKLLTKDLILFHTLGSAGFITSIVSTFMFGLLFPALRRLIISLRAFDIKSCKSSSVKFIPGLLQVVSDSASSFLIPGLCLIAGVGLGVFFCYPV